MSLRPGLDSIVLAMGRRLAVRSVTMESARRAALQFSRPGDSIVVRLAKPAGFRDTVRFTIDYRGKITQGRGLYFFKAEPGRPRHPQQVYSGGGTDGNPNWIPTYAAPNDKATWELVARVPADLTVVSNGRLVSDRPDPPSRGARAAGPARPRTHTVHWRQERPASTYLISLVAAPLKKVSDRWRDVPLDYYVYPEDVAQARRLFGVTPDMMETFSKLTGVKYPWAKYSQATVTDFIGGMENVGATTLVDWLPDARAYRDRPWYRQSLIPHELAHQWFGNLVTTENWSNYWLNEGMAEFMAGQYWGAKQGRRAEDDFYLDEYHRFLAAESRRSVPLASFNSNNVYTKGALVMQMLKKHLGPERFWASINRYLTRHAYGNATSDDLRRAVLHATGQNLDWFWDQWIYQAGYPRVLRRPYLRFHRGIACPHGSSDPGGHGPRRQWWNPLRHSARVSGAGDHPGRHRGGRRAEASAAGPAGAGDPDRGAEVTAEHGGLRRKQRHAQGADLRATDAVASDPAGARPRSLEPELGHWTARAGGLATRWPARRWPALPGAPITISPGLRRWARSPSFLPPWPCRCSRPLCATPQRLSGR